MKTSLMSCMIAVCLSYAINSSILWAILHFFFGWFYVIYWLFSYTDFAEFIRSFVVV